MKPPRLIRLLVCGGRDLDSSDVWNWLERFARGDCQAALGDHSAKIGILIHGGAHGADEGAASWGESENIPVRCFPAEWKKHGKAAGPLRNEKMLREGNPDVVIAFDGGRGTANMIGLAESAGIPVIRATALRKSA
jgi:hypothetical protein